MTEPSANHSIHTIARPDIYATRKESMAITTQRQLSLFERLYNQSFLRKAVLVIILAFIWQGYAVYLNNSLLFPTFFATLSSFISDIANGRLESHIWVSIHILLIGYGLGILLAGLLTSIAVVTRIGTDLLELMTAMFNPLPSIALLPLAMIWFGLGDEALVFVIVQSVIWAVALNTYSGFRSVSPTLRMIGQNYGLGHFSYISKILIPAAFPSILAGLKISWAFAWRTLIASELVFGVSSGSGGLGWFIYEAKNSLNIPEVFAGLMTIIIIGLAVDNLIFRTIENHTVRRWGIQT